MDQRAAGRHCDHRAAIVARPGDGGNVVQCRPPPISGRLNCTGDHAMCVVRSSAPFTRAIAHALLTLLSLTALTAAAGAAPSADEGSGSGGTAPGLKQG